MSNSKVVGAEPWSAEEDKELLSFVEQHGARHWRRVAKTTRLKRDAQSCRMRWTSVLSRQASKLPFTAEEDRLLLRLVSWSGETKWATIASHHFPTRSGFQIQQRWHLLSRQQAQQQHQQQQHLQPPQQQEPQQQQPPPCRGAPSLSTDRPSRLSALPNQVSSGAAQESTAAGQSSVALTLLAPRQDHSQESNPKPILTVATAPAMSIQHTTANGGTIVVGKPLAEREDLRAPFADSVKPWKRQGLREDSDATANVWASLSLSEIIDLLKESRKKSVVQGEALCDGHVKSQEENMLQSMTRFCPPVVNTEASKLSSATASQATTLHNKSLSCPAQLTQQLFPLEGLHSPRGANPAPWENESLPQLQKLPLSLRPYPSETKLESMDLDLKLGYS